VLNTPGRVEADILGLEVGEAPQQAGALSMMLHRTRGGRCDRE
jgi:hypothetical protein